MKKIIPFIYYILLIIGANLHTANASELNEGQIKAWLKTFEVKMSSKDQQALSTMLSDNFEYEVSSTENGISYTVNKDEFLADILKRQNMIEKDKQLDFYVDDNSALVVQDRQVSVVSQAINLRTELIDYFYFGQENGKTVLLRLQTEEQSEKTVVTAM